MTALPTPSAAALRAARSMLRTLSGALQTFALYPERHPNRAETVRELLALAREVQSHSTGDPVFFVARSSFYLGPTLLARESLALVRLIDAFDGALISAVELLPSVTEADLGHLVLMLRGEATNEGLGPGLLVNRVEPTLDVEAQRAIELHELRQMYAGGLEVLRQAALNVAGDQPIDLDAATSFVEQLADEVVRDPAHALLLTTVKSYDEYTYYHMVNVCMLTIATANAIGLHREQVITLGLGGLLHDVGKVNVPTEILTQAGRLDEEQWRLIQKHPVDGAGLIFGTKDGVYHPAASVVLEHHSAFDLAGYPALSERPHPSLPARLVSVADCFDAVTSKRAYRAAAGRQEALGILESAAGTGFDPRIVSVFVNLLGVYPVGSVVRLDSGEVALVIDNDDAAFARPTVRPLLDRAGDPVTEEDRDLGERGSDGEFRWNVLGQVPARDLGLDVVEYLATGDLDAALSVADEPPQGLVHEPSPGEHTPDGYVDTHADPSGHAHLDGEIDADVAPPFEQ